MQEALEEILPLAPGQTGMVFHALDGTTPPGAYVASVRAQIGGHLDVPRLREAIGAAVQASDAMRAGFIWQGTSKPLQTIARRVEVPFSLYDLTHLDEAAQEAELAAMAEAERQRGFDLRRPPLTRVHLCRLGDERHALVWIMHHVISDGWSAGQLLRDVFDRYGGAPETVGRPARLRDVLVWHKRRDETADAAFWSRYLADAPDATRLSTDGEPNGPGPFQHRAIRLSATASEKLAAFARARRMTQGSVMLALWALVLRRYSGTDEVLFGQAFAGRPTEVPGIDRAIGAFVTTVPVRLRPDPDMTLDAFLRAVEADARARQPHSHLALSDIARSASLDRPAGTLIGSVFAVETRLDLASPNWGLTVMDPEIRSAGNYPLDCLVTPGTPEAPTELVVVSDPARLPEPIAEAVLADYAALLRAAPDAGDRPLRALVSETLAPRWPVAALPARPADASIVERIWQQAALRPDAAALRDGTASVSYSALCDRADRIAAALAAQGVGRGDIVPVAVARGIAAVTAILGVLRAGAAYAPVDPAYPAERRCAVLAACAPKVVLGPVGSASGDHLVLDPDAAIPDASIDAPLPAWPGPADTAYVIFTSGSQGAPKGVRVTHGNLAYSTRARDDVYGAGPDTFLLLSSLAFDSSVAGLFWTLATGGTLVMPAEATIRDPRRLSGLIEQTGTTHLLALPGLWAAVLPALTEAARGSLATVIVAGEALHAPLVAAHRTAAPGVRLVNEYGPTEGTVWCAAFDTGRHDGAGAVPIGTAIPGSALDILDPDGVALPDGVEGRLRLRGPGVAPGYLGRSDGFGGAYDTGDRAVRRRSNGQILFRGRADGQVKIRGHRVELGEVEAALATIAGRSGSAVVTLGEGRDLRLVAAVTDAAGLDRAALRARLADRLPGAMLPADCVPLPDLPKLPNGKIDRAALQRRVTEAVGKTETASRPPSGHFETVIAGIWEDLLNRDGITRDAHFFDLGGDSLKSLTFAMRAEECGLDLAAHEIFDTPVLSDLAASLRARSARIRAPHPKGYFEAAGSGAGTPFFMVHGSPQMMGHLARAVGRNRPLGFLYSHYLKGEVPNGLTVEAMAAEALAMLRDWQPSGPYRLGGYSMGALVALEIARLLRQAGEASEPVLLIAPALPARPTGMSQRILNHAKSQAVARRLSLIRTARRLGAANGEASRLRIVRDAYATALASYDHARSEVPAVVLQTQTELAVPDMDAMLAGLAPDSTCHVLPCSHFELQSDPDALAAMSYWVETMLNAGPDAAEGRIATWTSR